MEQAILALLTIVIGVGGCVGYFWLSNIILDKVIFPARGPLASRNITRARLIAIGELVVNRRRPEPQMRPERAIQLSI